MRARSTALFFDTVPTSALAIPCEGTFAWSDTWTPEHKAKEVQVVNAQTNWQMRGGNVDFP